MEMTTVEVEASYVPSVDLVRVSQAHIVFLKEVDGVADILRQPHVIANAMRRYENYWLPLLAHYPDRDPRDFLPPLDVHWVWHVHMLCPRQYRSDCIDVIGMVPDHRFFYSKEECIRAEIKTEKMWTAFCVGEKYHIDYAKIDPNLTYHKTSIQYQLAEASNRRLDFYYNISLPHYSEQAFLEEALHRYLKFINIKRLHREAFLVPRYDVDLVWQSHQLSPRAYIHDTSHWLGYILNHEENGKCVNSKFILSESETKHLWFDLYGDHFDVAGTGDRGCSSRGRLFSLTHDMLLSYKPKAMSLKANAVVFEHHTEDHAARGSMDISLTRVQTNKYSVSQNAFKKTVLLPKLSSTPFKWDITSSLDTEELVTDVTEKIYISIQIETRSYSGCCGVPRWTKAAQMTSATKQLNNYLQNSSRAHFTLEEGRLSVSLQGSIIQDLPVKFILSKKGFYQEAAVVAETAEQLWGPVPLAKLPGGGEVCQVANHLVESQCESNFTVRISHSLQLKMSLIQILHGDKLVVVSHLIGEEQLPAPTQMEGTKWLTLNRRKSERAMIIKNNHGDWAIIRGVWTGMKKADGEPGYLSVDILKLTTKKLTRGIKILARSDKNVLERITVANLDKARIDLQESSITLTADCSSPAEHLALAFSVLVMCVLCEPRPGDKPGTDRALNAIQTGKPNPDPGQFSLIEAAGYNTDTPSSSYLWWLWYENHKKDNASEYDNDITEEIECPWEAEERVTGDGGPDPSQARDSGYSSPDGTETNGNSSSGNDARYGNTSESGNESGVDSHNGHHYSGSTDVHPDNV